MDKKIISFQMPKDLYDKIKSCADDECINISAYIRKILVQYFKENINDRIYLQNNK